MKKFIKFLSSLLSGIMIASVLPTAYASDALVLSAPVYTIGSTIVESPQPGFVTTTVNVTNPSGTDTSACLVVSVTDSTTGNLVAVDSDSQTIPKNGSKALSKGITLAAGQTLNYYVWDNVQNHTPLRNTPPTDINNLVRTAKTNSADLIWDEVLDDKGIGKYILKINGTAVTVDGSEVKINNDEETGSNFASYSMVGLERNSSYNCEITAYDEEDLPSNSVSFDVNTPDMEYRVLTEADNNIRFNTNHSAKSVDSYTEADNVAGRDCYKNIKLEKGYPSFFYFPVSESYIGPDMKNVAFEITYYDDSASGALAVQYNSEGKSSGGSCDLDGKTNTKTWKTVHAQVSNAGFENHTDLTNSSFRISAPEGTRIYKVAVCPGDYYSPDVPNVKFGDGFTETYDMSFYPEDAMSAYNMLYLTKDGVSCMQSPTGGAFEFNIKDDCATKVGGYVEATYYDDGSEDALVLNYTNSKNLKKYIPFTNTQQFKTVQIPLEAADFSNAISGAAGKKFDFTLFTQLGSPLTLASVKYVPGGVDNVPEGPEGLDTPETENEIYAQVNSKGTAFKGSLVPSIWGAGKYDGDIGFSGIDDMPPQDKPYAYNREHPNGASSGWRRWMNSFYFKVPDDFLYGTDYNKVEIEVEYYAPSKTDIQIVAKNSSGGDVTIGPKAATIGTWTTAVFTITSTDGKNVSFNNTLSGCDFRFNFKDTQGYLHKVTIRKVNE